MPAITCVIVDAEGGSTRGISTPGNAIKDPLGEILKLYNHDHTNICSDPGFSGLLSLESLFFRLNFFSRIFPEQASYRRSNGGVYNSKSQATAITTNPCLQFFLPGCVGLPRFFRLPDDVLSLSGRYTIGLANQHGRVNGTYQDSAVGTIGRYAFSSIVFVLQGVLLLVSCKIKHSSKHGVVFSQVTSGSSSTVQYSLLLCATQNQKPSELQLGCGRAVDQLRPVNSEKGLLDFTSVRSLAGFSPGTFVLYKTVAGRPTKLGPGGRRPPESSCWDIKTRRLQASTYTKNLYFHRNLYMCATCKRRQHHVSILAYEIIPLLSRHGFHHSQVRRSQKAGLQANTSWAGDAIKPSKTHCSSLPEEYPHPSKLQPPTLARPTS